MMARRPLSCLCFFGFTVHFALGSVGDISRISSPTDAEMEAARFESVLTALQAHEQVREVDELATRIDSVYAGSLGEGARTESEEPAARLKKEQVCYNELTVLGDLNDDGRFSPEEWHLMFKLMAGGSNRGDWRITPAEFRKALPNCPFQKFAEASQRKADAIDKKSKWFDIYEWQGALIKADANSDFLVTAEELVPFEPHGR